jgi:hypothetical protein
LTRQPELSIFTTHIKGREKHTTSQSLQFAQTEKLTPPAANLNVLNPRSRIQHASSSNLGTSVPMAGQRAEYRMSDVEDEAPEEDQIFSWTSTEDEQVRSRMMDASATSKGEEDTVEEALDDHSKGAPTPLDSAMRVRCYIEMLLTQCP